MITDLEQFVSDAVETLDPPVSAAEIAELYLDQNPECTTPEKTLVKQIRYYLT